MSKRKMTEEERAAARERCETADDKPWVVWSDDESLDLCEDGDRLVELLHLNYFNGGFNDGMSEANWRFVAHSRTDLPLALDTIDIMEGEREQLTHALKEAADWLRYDYEADGATAVEAMSQALGVLEKALRDG